MNDQIESHVSIDSASDKPLVTFALFAYNQEKYIREAVEGAFAQTYEPLEIILSDDCSTDRTLEIMQEMAAAYGGPHRVIVRHNPCNIGTALHVQFAFLESTGVLFVVAAGDDISKSNRVDVLYSTWKNAGCPIGVVHSGREVFSNNKHCDSEFISPKPNSSTGMVLEDYAYSQWLPAAAPTCAYTREVFEIFGPLQGGSIIEDAPLMLRAALIGKFISSNEILVRQRVHAENTASSYSINSPARWNRFVQSKAIAFRNMQIDLAHFTGSINPELRMRIERRIAAVLRSISSLLISETTPLSLRQKIIFVYSLVFSNSFSESFRMRVEYALTFFGFTFHARLKTSLRNVLRK